MRCIDSPAPSPPLPRSPISFTKSIAITHRHTHSATPPLPPKLVQILHTPVTLPSYTMLFNCSPSNQINNSEACVGVWGGGQKIDCCSFTAESEREKEEWIEAVQESIAETLSDYEVAEKIWFNEANRSCADCRAPQPEWASVNLGVVVCKKCAGKGPRLALDTALNKSTLQWSEFATCCTHTCPHAARCEWKQAACQIAFCVIVLPAVVPHMPMFKCIKRYFSTTREWNSTINNVFLLNLFSALDN